MISGDTKTEVALIELVSDWEHSHSSHHVLRLVTSDLLLGCYCFLSEILGEIAFLHLPFTLRLPSNIGLNKSSKKTR